MDADSMAQSEEVGLNSYELLIDKPIDYKIKIDFKYLLVIICILLIL